MTIFMLSLGFMCIHNFYSVLDLKRPFFSLRFIVELDGHGLVAGVPLWALCDSKSKKPLLTPGVIGQKVQLDIKGKMTRGVIKAIEMVVHALLMC